MKQQVALIYSYFITRKECFRIAARNLLPPASGHVCIPSAVLVLTRDQLVLVFNKGGSESEGKRKKLQRQVTTGTRLRLPGVRPQRVSFCGWFKGIKVLRHAGRNQGVSLIGHKSGLINLLEVGNRSADQSLCFTPQMRQRKELWIKLLEWMRGKDRYICDGESVYTD